MLIQYHFLTVTKPKVFRALPKQHLRGGSVRGEGVVWPGQTKRKTNAERKTKAIRKAKTKTKRGNEKGNENGPGNERKNENESERESGNEK